MLIWGDPWLDRATAPAARDGPCLWTARTCKSSRSRGRLEPGSGIRTLEQLVGYVVDRLKADDVHVAARRPSPARACSIIGGLPYLGARVTYVVPTTV